MTDLSAYRLTILGAIVVIMLAGAVTLVLGGPVNAAPYLGIAGTVAVPALLALLRSEGNAQIANRTASQSAAQHVENQLKITATDAKIDRLSALLLGKEQK